MNARLRGGASWLFRPQAITRRNEIYDVPRILFPLWWCMYHTIGRLDRLIENSKAP